MRCRGAGLLVLLCPELFLHTHDQRTDVAALQFPLSISTRLRANRIVGRRTASPAAGSAAEAAASSSGPRGGRSKSSASSPSADRVRLLRDARILLIPPVGARAVVDVVESGLADAIVQSSSSGASASASAGAGASASSAMLSGQGMQHSVLESVRLVLGYGWVLLQSLAPSTFELQIFLRLVVAAMVGMFIGTERRTSHRPAGVRTMSLVALGACTFTLVSQFGFVGKADQARVAASVASGVGFIGAGVITTSGKEASSMRESLNTRGRGGSNFPGTTVSMNDVDGEVKGLTTASAIWITAGLGMACGAGLLFIAMLGAGLTVGILKISEVTTSVQKKWARVRSVLRPKLAQKLADEANTERTGSTPEHNHEDHDDDEEDDVDHEQEMASKEQQERQEKEKEERQEINDKTEQEKEHYRLKLLEVEQENEKLKAQNKVDERVAEEAGSPVPSGKPGRGEADSGEHRGPSPGKESQDVEYGFDPFYAKPWGTEVPKVRPGVGDASETPPVTGPTRRRPLSRSRVLASRKKRWNQNRGGGPDVRVDYTLNSLSLDDAGEAVSAPLASLGRRAAEDPRVSRSAATVGDMVMKEKEMESQQQMKKAGRDAEAVKEGDSGGDLGGSIVTDTRGGGGLKVPEEHLRTVESAAAVSLSGAMDAAAASDEKVVPAAQGTAKGQGETEAAGVSLMHGLVGVSAIAAVADGGNAGNVDAADEGGKRPLDEMPAATTDVSGEVEAFENVDHGQSAAHANEDKGESSSTEGEIGSRSAAAEPDLERAAASSSAVGAAGSPSVDGSADDSGAPCFEDDVPAETVVAVESKGEDPDHLLPVVDESDATKPSSEQLASSPGDVAKKAAAEEGVAESTSDGEQTTGSGGMSTAAGAGEDTTSLETADARADPSADGADVEKGDEDGKSALATEHESIKDDVDMADKSTSDASVGGGSGSGNGAEPKTDMREEVSTPQPESTAKAETDSSASDAGRGRDRWWGGRASSNVAPASEVSIAERSSAEPDDGSATGEHDSQVDLTAEEAEAERAHSSSVGGGVDSIPWLKPTKGAPGDGSRATRKDYTRGGKPKWRKGSGRGDVDGSEAKKAEDRGGDLASSVTVEPQGAGGLVVPSASEEPVSKIETTTVVDLPAMVDDAPAIDEEVMSPGEEKTVEQGETEAAEGSSVDGSTDDSGVPDVGDDTPVETTVAVGTEVDNSDPRFPAIDEADATDSSSGQVGSSPEDRAKEAAAKEDIAGSSSDGEEAAGGSGISTSADSCTGPLEAADARVDPSADGTGVEEGDEDGKRALGKEHDVDMADKSTSDASGAGGAGNGADAKADTQGEVSTPQPKLTSKAETDTSAADGGRGRDRWWGGRVSSTVSPASEVSIAERSSAEPDDGSATGEQDSQVDLAAEEAETDGAHSSSVGGGVDSIPWLKPAKGAPGDGSRATRKDYTRGGKPKWRKGSGRGDVDGSEAKKAEDRGGDLASSVTVEPQGAGGLVVPSASEEPVSKTETATVVDLPAMVDDVAAIDEEVMSPGEEKTVEQGETEAAEGSSVDGSTDDSGVPDVGDDTPVETTVAVETEVDNSDPRFPAIDEAGATDSSSGQVGSSPEDRAKKAAAKEDIAGSSSDGEEAAGGSGTSTSADSSTESMSLEAADARADPSADGAGVEEGVVDGKDALAKEKSIKDDMHMAGKDTSDGSASGRGDSGSGSSSHSPEATKEEENGDDLESSVTVDTQGTEELVVPSASEEPVAEAEQATVAVDAAAALDVEMAPAGEKKTVGQGETEEAGEVSTDGVGDVSGAAAEAEIVVAVDKDAGGQSLIAPKADLEDLMASSSGTAGVAARDSCLDRSPDDSAASGVDDESPAQASVAVNTEGEDTDHALTATDQTDVEIGSPSEQFANAATAENGAKESAFDGEQATDSGGMWKTAGASGKSPSLETADARAKPGVDDTDDDEGDDDGKSALGKEEEIMQDEVGVADKTVSDIGGGGGGRGSSSGKRTESITDTQGDVSTPQPASMATAETDSSSSGAGRSSEDGLINGSGAPGAEDDSLAEAVVAEGSSAEDSDDTLTAGDEAKVEVGSSSEQLSSSPRDAAKDATAEEDVAESSSDEEEGTGSGIMSTASGAGVETTSLETADARSHHMDDRAKPDADDTGGEEGNDDDKSSLAKEEKSIQGDADAAEEATIGGDDSGIDNGTKPKTDVRGEVSIPQPESTAKAATGTSASDAGRGGGRWWGGRVSDTVAPDSEVIVGARASAEPDDGRATEEQDSQVDSAEAAAETDGVRGDVDSFPWLKPAKGAPGDGLRTSRKDYARGGKPKWRKGSRRGDVGGSEAKKPESGGGSESSVRARTQGAEEVVVPSASEEPLPKVEKATVAVDGTTAVDEAVASPGEERTVGQGEREAAAVSLMGGVVDLSGVGGLGVGGAVSVDADSDGVTPANPGAKLEDDEGSSSATAYGAAGDSAVEGLMTGSGARGAADDSLAEAVGTVDPPGKDSDDSLTAGDEANVAVDSSSEQLPSSPGDTPKVAIAGERVAESSWDKEEATGSGIMSAASGGDAETTSLEPVDARAKPSANDTDSEEGDDDRQRAPAKEEENITDDVDAADKVTSDTSGGDDSGSGKGAESIADTQGDVSAPQLESTTKAETDSSASEAGRGRRSLWRGSEVDVGERASAESDGGRLIEEQDGQVDLAPGAAEADEATSSSVRDGVDSVPWWKTAKSALGEGCRASRKDLPRSGKPRWRKGSGHGDVGGSASTNVGGSEGKKTEETDGGLESSVAADTQGVEELVVPSASEEPLPKLEKDTAVDGIAAVDETVASPGEERTGGQVETEAAGVSLMGGAVDMSGLGGLDDGGAISVGRSSDGVTTAGPEANLKNAEGSSSATTDGAGGESSVDEMMSGSGAPGAWDSGQAEAVVAEDSPAEDYDDALTAGDEANVEVGSSSEQLASSPRDIAKEATAEEGVAESSLDQDEATGSGITASGAGVETMSLEPAGARAKPTADDTDSEEGDDYGKGSEESVQDNVNAADKPTSGNSGGGGSGSDNGAAESKAGHRGEVSTPQPESMAKAATDTSASDAGRGGGRWWGGRVSNAVGPASEVIVGERSSAEPDDGRATEEKDSQVDSAGAVAEKDGADSSSVRDGVDSFPWGKPVKGAPDDRSRASRKEHARSSKPRWRKGSGRGDVGDSEATNTEKSASGLESSVTADRQEAKGLAVPSASEEPAPKVEKATVAVDDIAAVDETVAPPGEEKPGGGVETEAAGVSLMGGVVDISGVGGLGDVGSASVDGSSDGVTTAGPEPDLKGDEGSSSSTADGAAGESSVDEMMDGSGAPDAEDDSLAEAVVAEDSPAKDSDDALTAGDEANVEVGSSSEQRASSPRDIAKEATAEERVAESSSGREEGTGSGIMSTASGAGVETTSLETADARAKPTADDTNGEEGDDDGKGSAESIQDDVDAADKPTSATGGGGGSGSDIVAAESKTDTQSEVSTPQPESTAKTETDISASDAGRGRDRWLGGRVSNVVGPASEVIVGERSSAKPDDGRATVEQDSQVDPAETVAGTDGADSSSVRGDVDSFPWLAPAKGAPDDRSRVSRKDFTRNGKSKWLRGSGRVNVDGSEGTKAEESYGGLESSVAPDTLGAEGLVVPSASEESVPEVEMATVAVEGTAAVDEAVASAGEETAVGQDESKTEEGFLKDGAVDVSGVAGLADVDAVSGDGSSDRVTTAGPEVDLEDAEASSSAVADVATGDSPVDGLVDVSRALGAGDDRPAETAVAVDSPGPDSHDALTAADKPDGKIGSSSGQFSSGSGERAKEATAGDGVTTSLEPADARAKPSADDTDGKEGDENGKRAATKEEESMQDDIGMADKPTSDTSGGDDRGSGNGAGPKMDMGGEVSTPQPEYKPTTDTSGGDDSGSGNGAEPKTDMGGEVSTLQPESMTKAESDASTSDTGRGRGRWWGGRVLDTVAPASEVSVGERASAKPKDGRATEEQDSQMDPAEPAAETEKADSSSVRGGVESDPRWTPAKDTRGDVPRTSRKDYTGSGKPKWHKSSGRGDVDGSEAKKTEESDGDLESSITADTPGTEELVVPSASEEPLPKAAVAVDDTGAVDEEVASAGEETALGQDETETAEGSLMHRVVDVSGVGAVGVGGAVSADTNSDGVTKADPEAGLEDDEESSSATADGAAGHVPEDGLIDDSDAPRGDDDRSAEGVATADTDGGDTRDQADAEVASSSEQLVTSTGDTAEADSAEEGVTESALGGEPADGSEDISTAVDSSAEITSLETADARAKPSAEDTDGEDGGDDVKGSLAKEDESIQDGVDTPDKVTSDTSNAGVSGSKNGAEPKADMEGEVSTPQPESTAKAEADGGSGRWWGGRVPDTVAQASDVGVGERSSVEPDDGRATEEQDRHVTSAETVAEADGTDSNSLRGGVDSVPRWKPANGAPGDDSKAARKDYARSGKPKWPKGSGRGDVDGSEAKKPEESGGDLESSVKADIQGAGELVVPSASEEPIPKVDENAGDDTSPTLNATTATLSGVGAETDDSTVGRAAVVDTNSDGASTAADSPKSAISPASQPQRLTSSPGRKSEEPADSDNGSQRSGGTATAGDASTAAGEGKEEDNGAKETVEDKTSIGEGDVVLKRAAAAAETASVGFSEGGAADAAIKGAGSSVGPSAGNFSHGTATGPESGGVVTGGADGAANGAAIVSDDDAKRARVKAKLGVAKLQQGEAEKAVSLFEQAALIDPGWWEVFYYAALAHETLGNTAAAAHALVSALGIPAQTEDAELAKLASLASQVLAALEDDEQHGSTAEILKTAMDSSGLMFAGTSFVRGEGRAGAGPPEEPRNERSLSGEDAPDGGAVLEEEEKVDLCDKIWEVIREVTAPLDASAAVDAPAVDDAETAERTEDEERDATEVRATSVGVDPDADGSALAVEEGGGGAEDPPSQPRRSTRTWAKGSGWAKGLGWTKNARGVGGARDSRT